jgi:arabinose-5-phosphate isomerase
MLRRLAWRGGRRVALSDKDDMRFALEVLEAEARAIDAVGGRLSRTFRDAVEMIIECEGHVVVTGIGKAGIIGQKISATLASTGTPSHFLHPVEAIHGDLGRIVERDVVLALSNSGKTEVVDLIPSIKRIGAKLIAITGAQDSELARHADITLDIGHIEEACHLKLAPTASTTAMLALGDALALTVSRRREFDSSDYATYHPGGELGRKLMKVEEIMRGLDQCACVEPNDTMQSVLKESPSRAGALMVVDEDGKLLGIFTDGDLRRHLQNGTDFLSGSIADVMTARPKRIKIGLLAQEAAKIMERYQLDELPVIDDGGKLCGFVDIQDLLKARLLAP